MLLGPAGLLVLLILLNGLLAVKLGCYGRSHTWQELWEEDGWEGKFGAAPGGHERRGQWEDYRLGITPASPTPRIGTSGGQHK